MEMFLISLKIMLITLTFMFIWVLYKMFQERKHNILIKEIKLSKNRLYRGGK